MTNVVLICADQWRADCFSASGHPDAYTPYLDDLIGRGTFFTRAYTPAPTCVPSRMSLLSGCSPETHGRIGYQDGIRFDAPVTMAQAFGNQGYQTQAIGKMHVYPPRQRVGFDQVILHDGYLHHSRSTRPDVRFYDDYQTWLRTQPQATGFDDEYQNGIHCNSVVAAPWERPQYQHPTNWVTDQGIDWLYRRDPTQPFFLMLSYHRPHAPYNPPRWAWDYYAEREMAPCPRGNWEDATLASYRNDHSPQSLVANYPPEVQQRAKTGYYGNITHLDTQIQRFIEALADFNLSQDTIIAFTSDHGDMMGDHGMWRKGLPFEGSARIPFFVTGPGIKAGKTDSLFDITDIMPTLLELVDLQVPTGIDGISQADQCLITKTPGTGSSAFPSFHPETISEGECEPNSANANQCTPGDKTGGEKEPGLNAEDGPKAGMLTKDADGGIKAVNAGKPGAKTGMKCKSTSEPDPGSSPRTEGQLTVKTINDKEFGGAQIRQVSAEAKREFLHGEHLILGQVLQWIIWGDYKYIWWSKTGRQQLFNLRTDPGELSDLLLEGTPHSSETNSICEQARRLLIKVLADNPLGFVKNGQLITGRPVRAYLGNWRAR